jgi:hypothetical protein
LRSPQRTVRVNVEFGHNEQADAFDPGRSIGQSGQHQVDDVVSQIVFASTDENLGAGDLVGAIRLGLGLAAHQTQIGAAMWLGQAHGASPLAAGHLVQIGRLLLRRAVGVKRRIGAMRQTRVHGPSLVGRVHHFIEKLIDHQRQTLATKRWVTGQRSPTRLDVLGVGGLVACGCRDLMGDRIKLTTSLVTADVEWQQDVGGEFATFFKYRIDGVGVHVSMQRHGLQVRGHIKHFVHHKLHVTQRGGINSHGFLLVSGGYQRYVRLGRVTDLP